MSASAGQAQARAVGLPAAAGAATSPRVPGARLTEHNAPQLPSKARTRTSLPTAGRSSGTTAPCSVAVATNILRLLQVRHLREQGVLGLAGRGVPCAHARALLLGAPPPARRPDRLLHGAEQCLPATSSLHATWPKDAAILAGQAGSGVSDLLPSRQYVLAFLAHPSRDHPTLGLPFSKS